MAAELRLAALVAVLVAALAGAATARADGEVGLIVQEGDQVKTYCIAFQGDGISGDALLRAAGYTFDAFGGGSGLAVCSINDIGCPDASSFASCFCKCQGNDCVYWAFFTRAYGKNWVYSSLAFNLLKAKDGDVHGWKWGKGSASSAPAPQDITFDQVCGHAPRGGAVATIAPTTTPPPTTSLPVTPLPATLSPGQTQTLPAGVSTPPLPPSPSVIVTIGSSPTAGGVAPSAAASAVTPPAASAEGQAGGSSGLLAFAGVAGALAMATVAALFWRYRHGN